MTQAAPVHSVHGEMRSPIRSESEAFRLAVATALATGVAILIGSLTEALVGVAAFAVMLLLAVIAYLRAVNPDRREPLRRAALADHPHGGAPGERHVLVVANEVLSGEGLRERIVGEAGGRVQLDVLAPVLASRVHHGVSDIDRELEEARTRLDRSLQWTREQGIEARGEVGDPSATTAIEDELRDFGADEVIVVTHAVELMTWQEREELQRLRDQLDLPVVHVVRGAPGRPDEGSRRAIAMSRESRGNALSPTHVDAIVGFLEGAGVAFELIEHEPVMSAAQEARSVGRPPERTAKTIVLHDGSAYLIAAITAADRIDLHKVRELLGAGRTLRLASEEEMAREFPSLEVGAVPPFGPMVPAAEMIDSALAAQHRILCPAGDHRHSLLVDPRDVVRITAATVADIREE